MAKDNKEKDSEGPDPHRTPLETTHYRFIAAFAEFPHDWEQTEFVRAALWRELNQLMALLSLSFP